MLDLVTTPEAMEILQTKIDAFQELLRDGYLEPDPSTRLLPTTQWKFPRSDVLLVLEIRKGRVDIRQLFLEMRRSLVETRALRHDVERMRFLLGLDLPIIGTDRDTLISIVLQAEDDLRAAPITEPRRLLYWARILYAISESHLTAITTFTDQKEPWRVFLALGRKLCEDQEPFRVQHDPEYRALYQMIYTALMHLRRVAYFHVQNTFGVRAAVQLFPEVKKCPHENVISLAFQIFQEEVKAKSA
jgi:hypothetical protein